MASAGRFLSWWKLTLLPSCNCYSGGEKGFGPLDGDICTVYRFTAGCIRPLCQPATENTMGQRFRFSGYGPFAFCFHYITQHTLFRIESQERISCVNTKKCI